MRKLPAAKSPAAEFNRLRQNLDLPFGHAGDGFTGGELCVEMNNARSSFGFGKDNGIRPAGDDGIEVGIGHACVEAIDAHEQARALFGGAGLLEKLERRVRGGRFALRND